MGWILGGGLGGLLMAVLIYVADTPDFLDEAPLSGIALVVLGLQMGEFIRRRRVGNRDTDGFGVAPGGAAPDGA
jgi:hypothetical protein